MEARAALQSAYNVVVETNAKVQMLANSGDLTAVPIETKAALNADCIIITVSSTTAGYLDGAISDIPTVAEILAGIVEGSLTMEQVLRIMLAALAEKSSGGGTATVKFRDHADSKDRITATVDTSGNRTAVTPDGS